MSAKDSVVIIATLSMMCIAAEAALTYVVYSTGLVFGVSFVTVLVTAVFATLGAGSVFVFYSCWLRLKTGSSRAMTEYEIRAAGALIDADCTGEQVRSFVPHLS